MNQETFPAKFIRPTSETTTLINWISIETTTGNRLVKKGHEPLLTRLRPNTELTLETDEHVITSMTLPGGIVQITRTDITIIVDE